MNITFWLGIFIGLLIGWLIEWLIDLYFWRRPRKTGPDSAEFARLQQGHAQLSAEVQKLQGERRQAVEDAAAARTALSECTDKQTQMTAEFEQLWSENANLKASIEAVEAENERLTGQLNVLMAAGAVAAVASMADTSADDASADDTAETAAASADTLIHTPAPADAPAKKDPLVDINGIGPVYQKRLYAAGVTSFTQLAALPADRLREIVQAQEWQNIDAEEWIAEARVLADRGPTLPPGYDRLEDINGIGPIWADILYKADITTFAKLATLTPEALDDLVPQEDFQRPDFTAWIAEAAQRAAGIDPTETGA